MVNHTHLSERSLASRCLSLFALAALTAVGCSAGPDDAATETEGIAQQLQAPASSTGPVLRDPAGTYFAQVTANGTGCPPGSWVTSLADDGTTFTTTFSKYEAQVTPTTTFSAKDCNLAIKLHSPQGLSYSVASFYYSGYAYLEKGISGRQFASYYFQGNPAQSAQLRTDLVGPYDDDYLFTDKVAVTDAVWSPCGVDRDLNVVTRLRLVNSSPRGTGYMNLSTVDASVKLVLKLAWRTCTTSP